MHSGEIEEEEKKEEEEEIDVDREEILDFLNNSSMGIYTQTGFVEETTNPPSDDSDLSGRSPRLGDSDLSLQLTPRRIDKRVYSTKHTLIISEQKMGYYLAGTLDEEESKELYKQTGLWKKGKTKLGKGHYGLVRIVINAMGHFLAVKKIHAIESFQNEFRFQKLIEEKGIKCVLPVYDAMILPNWEGKPTIYQIMPIANLGSGFDLLLKMDTMHLKDRRLVFKSLFYSLIFSFQELNEYGMFHTDFKPDNFLINFDENGVRYYLADVGAAVFFDSRHRLVMQVSASTDIMYHPPEKNTSIEANIEPIERFQKLDAWRLGLTLLLFIDLRLGFTYMKLASELTTVSDHETRLIEYEKLHKVLLRVLRKNHIPHEMTEILIGFLDPYWHSRLIIPEAAVRMKVVDIDQHRLNQIFKRLLQERAIGLPEEMQIKEKEIDEASSAGIKGLGDEEELPIRKVRHKQDKTKQVGTLEPVFPKEFEEESRLKNKNKYKEKEQESPKEKKKEIFGSMRSKTGMFFKRTKKMILPTGSKRPSRKPDKKQD